MELYNIENIHWRSKMKKISLIFLLVCIAAYAAFSSVPGQINFQGILKDSQGKPVTSSSLSIAFSIYADQTTTVNLWTETQSGVSIEGGLYSVQLGSVNPIGSSIFDGSTRYLGIAVGSYPEMSPRLPLISVPYAYRAAVADSSGSLGGVDVSNLVRFGTSDAQVTSLLYGSYLKTSNSAGVGVIGYASAALGTNFGGYFRSDSTTGRGVGGLASSTSGANYGGYFQTESDSGAGVYGRGDSGTGNSYGGQFESGSSTGIGVYGKAPAYGGSFEGTSATGVGIYARGTNIGGSFFGSGGSGGSGVAASYNGGGGSAVRGDDSSANGTSSSGGYFITSNTSGYSGQFQGGRGIRLSQCVATASSTGEGTIRFDSTDKHFYGYSGAGGWKQLDN